MIFTAFRKEGQTLWARAEKMPEHIFESPIKADPAEIPDVPIFDYIYGKLCEKGKQSSTEPWVIDARTGVQVPFSDIEDKSRRFASALTRLGFKQGDVLHFITYETARIYLIKAAVWRLGGAIRGSFQMEAPEEFARQLNETRARFLLVEDDTVPNVVEATKKLDWTVTVINFGTQKVNGGPLVDDLFKDDGSAFPTVDIDVNGAICIANTSGSTGLPKGVVHTHKTLVSWLYNRKTMDMFRYSLMTPMSNFAMGVNMATTGSIAHGITVIHLGKFVREEYFDNMIKFKPGNALMYPFVTTWFARHERLETADLSFLKGIIGGGAVIDPTTIELLNKKLPHVRPIQSYGMTESLSIVNTEIMNEGDKRIAVKIAENEGEQCVSSGKLVPYVKAKIIDLNTGESLGPNKRGQIHVLSPHTMKGYLTAESRVPISPNVDKDGWLATGDAGFFDDEGYLYITERLSFVFKYFMFFVSPSEIEAVLQKHPAVAEVGVVGVPHPESTNLARAFVVRKGDCTEEELCKFVADRLPTYKHLHGGLRFIEKLPEGKAGKMDRAELKRIAIEMD